MPTTPIRRVRTTVTGVAGSPYYINGYFDAGTGTTAQCITAWHRFVLDQASAQPNGAVIRTEAEVPVINPVTGEVIQVETSPALEDSGTNTNSLAPPSTQLLVRWRTGQFIGAREVRGRTNLPMMFSANVDSKGDPVAALRTSALLRANTLIADANTVNVVWSKTKGVWFPVLTTNVWTKFAVLRSRRD